MTDFQRKDLLELLEINGELIPRKSLRCAGYFQRRWMEVGTPTEAGSLIDFLDSTIDFCKREELTYPKVFLLRLKQLQRGEWAPCVSLARAD